MNARASISAKEVHDLAGATLQQCVKIPDYSERCPASIVMTLLFYAAARITSLSDACARLSGAPSDETLRQALLAGLPEWAELQRRLNRGLGSDLPKGLLERPQVIAIDTHEVPYHGQPQQERDEIRRGKPRRGTTHFHDYATAYVVRHGYRFTLGLAWVHQSDSLADVVRDLLRQVRQCGVQVRLVLLDRGFYSAEVVRYLQAARTPFLMPLKAAGRLPKDPRKARRSARRFFEQKRSGMSSYTWRDKHGRKATVQVCICCRNYAGWKRKRGRYALVYAYWGIRPGTILWVRQTYRRRFGIETSYRQMERARIRTSSRDPLRRLLFAGVALILRNAWVWLHLMRLGTRHGEVVTLHLELLRFSHLLLLLQRYAERLLDPDPPDPTQPQEPKALATNLA